VAASGARVLNPEAVEVVREAYWIAIIWVILHEPYFAHIAPKTIALRLAKLVIQQAREGGRDAEKISQSVLNALRAEQPTISDAIRHSTIHVNRRIVEQRSRGLIMLERRSLAITKRQELQHYARFDPVDLYLEGEPLAA
jgi:CRP-like cAMP-binding protein